jgi:hypothetical protein
MNILQDYAILFNEICSQCLVALEEQPEAVVQCASIQPAREP